VGADAAATAFAGDGDRIGVGLPAGLFLAATGFAEAFFLAFFAGGAARSGALTLPLDALPLDALLRATFAFFAGRWVARALLEGERLLAFAVDRFFAAMSILIIRYRDR
jgi:hypothetical protein